MGKVVTDHLNIVIISVTSDFKKQGYGPGKFLLQGHAVTLTFKVATQMLLATWRLNIVISVK